MYDAFPVYAEAFDAACGAFEGVGLGGLRGVMWSSEEVHQTRFAQAALFVHEVALVALLESWGVVADVVAGHSLGGLTAAYVAGVWSLGDAARLIEARGRLMQALSSGGAMAAVEASEAEVREAFGGIDIAAVNGPRAVVVSGPEAEVEGVREYFRDRRSRRLSVSHAFHSVLMEPVLDAFREVVAGLECRPPLRRVISDATGEVLTAEQAADPDYWVGHVRGTVRFADVVANADVTRFVEIGPDAALTPMVQQTLPEAVCFPLQRAGQDE
ncbi:acyltransferase domain-containing protein, partial [Streptomyces humidus]